jgi:hypothetical protein
MWHLNTQEYVNNYEDWCCGVVAQLAAQRILTPSVLGSNPSDAFFAQMSNESAKHAIFSRHTYMDSSPDKANFFVQGIESNHA